MTDTPSWQWSREADGALGAPVDGPGYMCGRRLATWFWRMLAAVIDYGLFLVLPFGLLGRNTFALLVAGSLTLANSGVLAAYTTQSLGKRITGIKMVWVKRARDRGLYVVPVPIGIGVIRVLLHVIDYGPCGLGFLLPIINKSKGTLADYSTKVLHFRDPNLPRPEHGVVGTCEWV